MIECKDNSQFEHFWFDPWSRGDTPNCFLNSWLKYFVSPYPTEVNVSLTYADYYFIKALLRYKKWYL